MWKLIGMVGAVVGFFVGAIGWDNFRKQDPAQFAIGLAVAVGVYLVCLKKDSEELDRICEPPAEVWPVPLPVAWGCIKDVLEGSTVVTGASGASGWRIQQEDDSRGIIAAQLNFMQQLGGPMTAENFARTITCSVQLTPEGSSTRVKIEYQIVSPMGEGLVKNIIQQTQDRFRTTMEAHSGGV